MNVLFVSAEVAPYSSVGGLSQVSRLLPRALLKEGINIRIFTPKYGTINDQLFPTKTILEGLRVPTGEEGEIQPKELICNVKVLVKRKENEPIVYFLENMEYYEKRANVYDYSDDHIRFGLLSRAALEFLRVSNFTPDVIHCNDWHTGYLINYLKTSYKDDPKLKNISTLFSIHNLFQGIFDFDHCSELDFDDGKSRLASFFSERFLKQNALKRGVIYADLVNAVSETYAREIMTEEYGGRLANLFRELRDKISGVLNGLDYNEFNPLKDKIIKKNFGLTTLKNRIENKIDLQREFGLKESIDTPIIAFSGRLGAQKGLSLLMNTLDFILTELDVQFVVLGNGEDIYRNYFAELEKKYPGKVGTHLMANFTLPRKIFAGADILLMPSKYEPGGIVALEAMRYGCVPVARATGGLADSIINYDSATGIGTGFTFKNFSEMSFLTALVRALEIYRNKKVWKKIVYQTMKQDFSWEHSAKEYIKLYKRAVEIGKKQTSL